MGAGYATGLPAKFISDVILCTATWMEGDAGPEATVLGPPPKR